MNSSVKIVSDEQRIRPEKSEVSRLWCDNTKINSLTGFKPKHDLEKGLQRTIAWFLEKENLKKYKSTIYNV
jgi:nucleoside-diphosphate-sugar epimerase